MPNPTPGTVLGAFRVEGPIGSGSMGDVFRGIDTGLHRKVAIKILSERHRDSNELRARFVREGRAVAAISHPNVVQVFATGTFDDRPYIAMELLDGTDLGSTVEKTGPLDSTAAAHAILDAAQGLTAAAKAGLIHRDVKPSNLVRLPDGRVKVTDFGLAKPVEASTEPALTAMGVVVGTPDYIAPEQARGEKIDERVDIYALGGSLYFILTGVPPFRTGRPADDKYLKVVARHLRNPPPDASVTNPNVDPELAAIGLRMMAKKPDDRPTYADLVSQLTGLLARLDPGAVPELILATRERSRPNTAPNIISSPGSGAQLSQPPKVATPKLAPSPVAQPTPVPARAPVTDAKNDAGSSRPPVAAVPGWVIALTVLCLGLFATGLVVYLQSRASEPSGLETAPAIDAPAASGGAGSAGSAGSAHAKTPTPTPAADAAVTTTPIAPTGMLVVSHADGTPWLFVDAAPVTIAAYGKLFPPRSQEGSAADPVVRVSYDEARSYARTRGGRLLRSDEWDAAASTSGYIVADGTYEWVDSFEPKKTVRRRNKTDVRPDSEQPDVTFRVAKDL